MELLMCNSVTQCYYGQLIACHATHSTCQMCSLGDSLIAKLGATKISI